MKTYVRELLLYNTADRSSEWVYEIYRQSRRDRLVYTTFRLLWQIEFSVKPLSWLSNRVVEPVLKRLHRRSCRDGCTLMTDTRTGVQLRVCGRLPWTAQLDCKLYDLDHRNNVYTAKATS